MAFLRLIAAVLAVLLPQLAANAVPDPLFTDPPHDAVHPAKMEVVHIPTHGVTINGVLYVAAGEGPHPTLIFFHGLPGNEQNLDLAQGVRRLGWNVLTLHYRGSWGSPGVYSYTHLVEDGVAVLAFVRDPRTLAAYQIDPRRIVVAGHSTGGFVAVNAVAQAAPVAGLVLISGTDDAEEAIIAHRSPSLWQKFIKEVYADSMETLAGCTPKGLAQEVFAHAESWRFAAAVPALRHIPLLVITSDDGYAPESEALAHALQRDDAAPQLVHFATDHPYSDQRIALQETVARWLNATIR
jgi:pimeloyl-ACP methyl ester carboxylesterase